MQRQGGAAWCQQQLCWLEPLSQDHIQGLQRAQILGVWVQGCAGGGPLAGKGLGSPLLHSSWAG